MGQQSVISGNRGYSVPCLVAGQWGTAGGVALQDSLSRGSALGVMDVLHSMDVNGVAATLREVGFAVSPEIEARGTVAVLADVQRDLNDAIELRVDGRGLAAARANLFASVAGPEAGVNSFAAKERRADRVVDSAPGTPLGFAGNLSALQVVQRVMGSKTVSVDLLGDAEVGERTSLALIAGQAMQKGIQGFGFEGVAGKFQVPMTMQEMAALHKAAARDVAIEAARGALGVWANEGRVGEVVEWVPNSVQRLLHGSVSVESAAAIVSAIQGGEIGQHGEAAGAHAFSRLLAEQGYDVNAPTVAEQAEKLGLTVIEPNTERGQYFGPVVGKDHRAALVKSSREAAVDLPFSALPPGVERPEMGDMVRMRFTKGELAVSVQEKSRDGIGGR